MAINWEAMVYTINMRNYLFLRRLHGSLWFKVRIDTPLELTIFLKKNRVVTRIRQKRNLKNYTKGSNVANHVWQNSHSIDFDNACVIDQGNYRVRKTLECWHTAKTVDLENNSKPCLDNTLFYCNSTAFAFLPLSFFHTSFCILFFFSFKFSHRLLYISVRAPTFSLVNGYRLIAESLCF